MTMTRFARSTSFGPALAALTALALVGACSYRQPADRAQVEIKGSNPAAPATAPGAPYGTPGPTNGAPAANGIISYDGYQAAAAQQGDTVASVAARIGLSASELGAYNGLAPDHPLRPGDELVLPPRPGGYAAAAPQAEGQMAQAAPGVQPGMQAGQPGIQSGPIGSSTIEAAPLDGSAPAAAPNAAAGGSSAAGWSPDLAAAAISRATGIDNQGNLEAPPSSTAPLPPAPKAPGPLASPELRQYQTPPSPNPVPQSAEPQPRPSETITTPAEINTDVAMASPKPEPAKPKASAPAELKLIPPVRGPIVVGFNQSAGHARSDGVDFAAPAGSPVVAAADGEVALVSKSLGGLGTIVLLRHSGDYLTVYGRIDNVSVVKGNLVQRGQKIGSVAATVEPRMHFEVRKGAESLDPTQFF